MNSARYVYAIVRRGTQLQDGDLVMVPFGELAAVTGPSPQQDSASTIDAVLRHEEVVEAVRRQGPALPVRFGTLFRDATSVASALAERYEPLATELGRLGDKLELSITALWVAPPLGETVPDHRDAMIAPRTEGARYLRARADELRQDDALKARARLVARDADAVLRGMALDSRVSLLPTPRIAFRSVSLLEPRSVVVFRAAFEKLRLVQGAVRLLLTGPWPPYSFVRPMGFN